MSPKKKSPLLSGQMRRELHGKKNAVSRATAWTESLAGVHTSLRIDIGKRRRKDFDRILWLAAITIMLIFAGLIGRLFYIQVVHADRYVNLANGNRLREKITYAPRGRIFDQAGEVLADNTSMFQLSVTPYLLETDPAERGRDARLVADIIGASTDELQSQMLAKGVEHVLPILIKERLGHSQAIQLEQILPRIKGFSLDEVPVRSYVSEAGFGHVVGYVGRVDENDLDADGQKTLLPIDFIGRSGVERQYDEILRGKNGRELIEVDARGRPVRVIAREPAQKGHDIALTLNATLQRRLEADLRREMTKGDATKASAVALDPRTGQVRAMVSIPYYDNNLFSGGILNSNYESLLANSDQPLTNKVVSGGYPSGSAIKTIVASAALQERVVSPDTVIVDRGFIDLSGGFRFRGYNQIARGPLTVRDALAVSSNVYFYTVGGGYGEIGGLGVDRLTSYYRAFGFGEATGIDLPAETNGRVPDREWKRANKDEDWYIGDTYNISIGQGDILISPLQMAVAQAAIANGGDLLAPRVLGEIDGEQAESSIVRRHLPVDQANLQVVREGMRKAVEKGLFSETIFSSVPAKIAGKSGTAETGFGDDRIHSWFAAYAPYESPELLVTVMIENGRLPDAFVVPAVGGIFEQYMHQRE